MMDNTAALSRALFACDTPAPAKIETPSRNLPQGAAVTRFAPSPTGFLHLGHLLGALADHILARRSGGVFLLRLEDTDKKREVAHGIAAILEGLAAFGILPEEGVQRVAVEETADGPRERGIETGDYGPYIQSSRRAMYHAYARQLVEQGLAYPCFCTAEELEDLRAQQEAQNVNKGYYGTYAKCSAMPLEEQLRRIAAGEPYTLRLRSPGDASRKIIVNDLARGKLELPEYDMDVVLLKADGMPTYHFANAVDDHLMQVTHVIRGDEWLASLPLHIQLFRVLGFQPPKYAHIAPLMKEENGGKRKLSKRKDPEAAVTYFVQQGFPSAAVQEYLLTLLNSNFEDWRRANPAAELTDFPFSLKKISASGALFDLRKLEDVSKNVISRMSAEQVFAQACAWAEEYDQELHALLCHDPDYATAMFAIDRGNRKPRKDIARWNQLRDYVRYFFDDLFEGPVLEAEDARQVLAAYHYDPKEDKDAWFARIKALCEPLGYCPEVKAYKQNPEAWKGHVGDVSGIIRLAVTGRSNTPDLWAVMQVLGAERVAARCSLTETKKNQA